MIKFLHCADLHLDSPLSALDVSKAEVRHNEMRAAFTSLTLYAQMNKIDFLIISGDLFDSGYATKDTAALLSHEFANIPDCKVIISPGNHDPYTSQSYYKRADFSDNVYIFDSPELSCFDFPDKNTTIYGYAFTSDKLENCPFDGFTPENPSRINILAAHGELVSGGAKTGIGTTDKCPSDKCPITPEAIKKSGFDYIALGHYHAYSDIKKLGNTYFAYSGCLEGRGFDELGPKGAIIGAIDKTAGALQFGAKFVRFSKRCYEIERLDVTGSASTADVSDKISSLIAEKHYGDDTALRVILTGNVASSLKIAPSFLYSQFPRLFLLEIEDETLPLLDTESLKYDPTIRGAFYNSLAGMLKSDDEKVRAVAAEALRCGLAALSGGDV